ncbi:MAG: hypothetical protein ACFFAT_20860 [Promethearchaeota archaeon]
MSKLQSRLEKSEIKYNQISNIERCKKDFIFLINNFDEIKVESEKAIEKLKELDSRKNLITALKTHSYEMQSIYSNNLNTIKEFKRMLKEGVDKEVVFAKFFRTYPYCMPNRTFINK